MNFLGVGTPTPPAKKKLIPSNHSESSDDSTEIVSGHPSRAESIVESISVSIRSISKSLTDSAHRLAEAAEEALMKEEIHQETLAVRRRAMDRKDIADWESLRLAKEEEIRNKAS